MLRALPIVMWIVDAELRVLFFRGGHAVDGEAVTQRPGVRLCEFLGEACGEEILDAHRAALRGETATATLSWLNRSWDVHVAEIEHDALSGGEVLGGEAVAVCVDVTKRERLQKALFDAQKLEAVGHLAGGVAHEINTPMQYVGDNLQFMQMAFEQFEKAFELLISEIDIESGVHGRLKQMKLEYLRREAPSAVSQSLEGVTRVSKIVRALKQSALMEAGPPEPTSLNTVVKNAVNVSQNEWKYTAEIECEFGEDLPMLIGVPGDLTRAVLALLVNASQAIKETNSVRERGLITLRTYATEDVIVLEIQDTGGGIPREIRDKIFHQFFTTKETGAGLGQGLTIARSILVDRHGANIDFEVDEGVGTTFVVKFPRSV
jgi:signal transduction histidine kinase